MIEQTDVAPNDIVVDDEPENDVVVDDVDDEDLSAGFRMRQHDGVAMPALPFAVRAWTDARNAKINTSKTPRPEKFHCPLLRR